jgi:hypothetical protein
VPAASSTRISSSRAVSCPARPAPARRPGNWPNQLRQPWRAPRSRALFR